MTVDYADNNTIDNMNYTPKESNVTKVTMVDNVSVVEVNDSDSHFVAKNSDKMYTIKEKTSKKAKKIPLVTITARPSCGCGYSYRWRTNTFIDYCPHCHKQGTLANVHKWPARHEQELTCSVAKGGCGADYCGVCGKEKYSWSHYYLTKA